MTQVKYHPEPKIWHQPCPGSGEKEELKEKLAATPQPPACLSSRFSFRWLQIHSYITSQCFYLHLNREVDLKKPPVGSEYLLPHYLEATFIQVKL